METVLQNIVEPIFKEAGIDFKTTEKDNVTEFLLLTHRFKLLGLVYYMDDLGVLSLWLKDIAKFEEHDSYAPTLVEKLNWRNPAKFLLDGSRLHYCVDMLITGRTTKEDFRDNLRLAAAVIDDRWDAINRVRYGGMTWEQANRPVQRRNNAKLSRKVNKQIEEILEQSSDENFS